MTSERNLNKFPGQNRKTRAAWRRSVLLALFILSASSLLISQGSVENFEPLWSFGFGSVVSVDYSPDGSRIAVSGSSTVFILNATTYAIERQLFGHAGLIWSVKWSPDGRYVASSSEDTTVKIWEVETGDLVRRLEGHTRGVRSIAWSPNGTYLASGGYNDGTINIWEVGIGKVIRSLSAFLVASVAWSRDGNYVAANSCGNVRIWETKNWNLFRDIRATDFCIFRSLEPR